MELLKLRVAFLEKIRRHFLEITGKLLEDTRFLDYGCGYGMIPHCCAPTTGPDSRSGPTTDRPSTAT